MPRIAVNAEAWAIPRVGIFFPAHNQTPADGNLTGQCVTLNKWFLHEMTDVPSPFAARGDARYVGQTLVAQGHAVKVPYAERRRGDFAVFEYGLYGHIGVLLDADRIFEENVNVGGVTRRIISEGGESWSVFSARIGRLSESWRTTQATIYRIKTYKEEGDEMPIPNADNYFQRYRKAMWHIRGRDMSREEFNKNFVGNTDLRMLEAMLDSPEAEQAYTWQNVGKVAVNDKWQQQIYDLQAQVAALGSRPTKEQLAAVEAKANELTSQLTAAQKAADEALAKAKQLEQEKAEDEKTGNAFMRWLGDQLNKLLGR